MSLKGVGRPLRGDTPETHHPLPFFFAEKICQMWKRLRFWLAAPQRGGGTSDALGDVFLWATTLQKTSFYKKLANAGNLGNIESGSR